MIDACFGYAISAGTLKVSGSGQRERGARGNVGNHRLQIHLKLPKANRRRKFRRALPVVPDRIAPRRIDCCPLPASAPEYSCSPSLQRFSRSARWAACLALSAASCRGGATARLDGFGIKQQFDLFQLLQPPLFQLGQCAFSLQFVLGAFRLQIRQRGVERRIALFGRLIQNRRGPVVRRLKLVLVLPPGFGQASDRAPSSPCSSGFRWRCGPRPMPAATA